MRFIQLAGAEMYTHLLVYESQCMVSMMQAYPEFCRATFDLAPDNFLNVCTELQKAYGKVIAAFTLFSAASKQPVTTSLPNVKQGHQLAVYTLLFKTWCTLRFLQHSTSQITNQ